MQTPTLIVISPISSAPPQASVTISTFVTELPAGSPSAPTSWASPVVEQRVYCLLYVTITVLQCSTGFLYSKTHLCYSCYVMVRIYLIKIIFKFSSNIHLICSSRNTQMNRFMRKPAFSICETKMQISFAVTAELISAIVFAIRIVQSLYYLNPKF